MDNQVILYQSNDAVKVDVRFERDTVWLTQAQIAQLFGVGQAAISKHIRNVYDSEELREEGTYSILEYMKGNRAYIGHLSRQLQLDLNRHNEQYPPIGIAHYPGTHDRFLIIDKTLYLVGASLKDAGAKTFAVTRMALPPDAILPKEGRA